MSVIDTARQQIAGLMETVFEKPPHTNARQTVTVACTVPEAEDVLRDPVRLQMILEDLGDVTFSAPDRFRWRLHVGGHDLDWDSHLEAEPGRLRFRDGSDNEIVVSFSAAPAHLGTEITMSAHLPIPGLLSGALVFTLLYRARALVQTGEVPTVVLNPSGR